MDKNKTKSNMLSNIYANFENSRSLQSIRGGLVMLIPVLLIGSFSQVLQSLPIPAYQTFKMRLWGGVFNQLFSFINNATFGVLAVYLTIGISLCYSKHCLSSKKINYGPTIASVISFFVFSGGAKGSINMETLGIGGMFTAVVCGLGASWIYSLFDKWLNKRFEYGLHIYTDGADEEFNSAVMMICPCIFTVLSSVLFYYFFVKTFSVNSFQTLFSDVVTKVFNDMGRSLGTMLLFSILVSVLWFFGLHGNNLLLPVSKSLFESAHSINTKLILRGEVPTEIYSQTFYHVFCMLGGTGNVISLLIAIFLFSKRRSNRKLSKLSVMPMLFNISETITFGLPIVFNPIMLIPYVLTPVVLILFSSSVIQLGWVPIPTVEVDWTTPIILGGYKATGSIAGAVLQVVNVAIGVLIYAPFVKLYDKVKDKNAKHRMDKLVAILRQSEADGIPVELLEKKDAIGETAKSIADDLHYYLQHHLPTIYYQPQYDNLGTCMGAEALLRWEHPSYGKVFPPLVVKLAEELGILASLEKGVFNKVMQDMDLIMEDLNENGHISINVTGTTIQTDDFEEFLFDLKKKHFDKVKKVCIEITEQAALNLDERLIERLTRIRKMGYMFAIDDFSMGHTSIKYLQTNAFDLIKLDGALIKYVTVNPRSREIIASITELSKRFGIQVLAECVETEEQKKILEETGCFLYQGFLYSPAIEVEKFVDLLEKEKSKGV